MFVSIFLNAFVSYERVIPHDLASPLWVGNSVLTLIGLFPLEWDIGDTRQVLAGEISLFIEALSVSLTRINKSTNKVCFWQAPCRDICGPEALLVSMKITQKWTSISTQAQPFLASSVLETAVKYISQNVDLPLCTLQQEALGKDLINQIGSCVPFIELQRLGLIPPDINMVCHYLWGQWAPSVLWLSLVLASF